MTAALEVRGLTKRFGDVLALDGVDLTVAEGSAYGFLGPNGAGKTTTLRILTGLALRYSGDVELFGHKPGSAEARSLVGFLPDVPGYCSYMTAEEFLTFCGALFSLPAAVLRERVPLLLDMAGLGDVDTKIGGYSRGMKQRLGIAQALINAPKLLLLDEPTSALDPLGRREVLDMIAALKGRTTVFFSTHILADVERACDTVAVLDGGRVVTESGIDDLKARYGAHRLAIEVEGSAAALADALADRPWVSTCEVVDGSVRLAITDESVARREAPAVIAGLGLSLVRFTSEEVSLEDVFMQLVGERR